MAFWQEFSFPSTVDKLLETPDWTLEKLLDEDDVLVDDTREKKPKLLAGLTPHVDSLIKNVVGDITPPEGKRLRHPAVASEILLLPHFSAILAGNQDHLKSLFSLFEQSKPDPLLATAVVKVVISLVKQNPSVILFMKSHGVLDNILKHLAIAEVATLIPQLLKQETTQTAAWLVDEDFPEKMISHLDSIHSSKHTAVADIMAHVLELNSTHATEELFQRVLSPDLASQALNFMFEEDNNSGLVAGLAIFEKIFLNRNFTLLDKMPFIRALIPKLQEFHHYLTHNTPKKRVLPNGTEIEPLGFHRLSILKAIRALVATKYADARKAVHQAKLFQLALDQVDSFPTNNFYHFYVRDLFVAALEPAKTTEFLDIIEDVKLQEFLLKKHKAESTHPFYTPFVHHIARVVIQQSKTHHEIEDALGNSSDWLDYSTIIQAEHNKERSFDLEELKSQEGGGPRDPEEQRYLEEEFATVKIEKDALAPDSDMDSTTDHEDYDLDDIEVLVSKETLEAFSSSHQFWEQKTF